MAPIKSKAFINVDLGEAYGNFKCGPDEELFPYIDQANVACGFQYVKMRLGTATIQPLLLFLTKLTDHG